MGDGDMHTKKEPYTYVCNTSLLGIIAPVRVWSLDNIDSSGKILQESKKNIWFYSK